ncbi:MAG: DUF2203 family protein [Planctomycetota bacterium]
MKQVHHQNDAQRLVPLIDAIFREVADRRREIRLLEKQLVAMQRETENDADLDRTISLRAQLASHRRELRLARKEFERLGCQVDEHNPNRVLILGPNGRQTFRWDAGDVAVQRILSDTRTGS